ncbi:DUF1624 domain-containing protein [bacterium]|nr:DUF1624 domain-containing protein [bacterium]
MNPSSTGPGRIAGVDALRGATMAAMIVVNNPGSWSAMYPWLQHAPWGGPVAPADLIFPTFLFLVGVATPLAMGRGLEAGLPREVLLRKAARRSAELFFIGVFLNLYPEFSLATLRIPGVLQRIAVVFLACACAFLFLDRRRIVLLAVALAGGYTLALALVPVPGAGGPVVTESASLPVWLDDRILGAHTWRGPGDPEGILSTLPAVVTGLIGVLAGSALRRRPRPGSASLGLALAGAALLAGGALVSTLQPPIKELWNAPYVLLTGGWALVATGACLQVVDGLGWRRGLDPVLILGRHALSAFVAAHLLSDTAISVIRWSDGAGGTTSLHHLFRSILFTSWLPPEAASLAQSVAMLAVITAGLAVFRNLSKRRKPA